MAALAGAVAQRALMSCYLGPMLAPALMLGALWVGARLARRPPPRRVAEIAFGAWLLALALSAYGIANGRERVDLAPAAEAAQMLRGAKPAPQDRLYLINAVPDAVWIYALSGVRPATPYLFPREQLTNFPGVGPERIDQAFAARPRFVVTSLDYRPIPHDLTEAIAAADREIAAHYRRLGVAGAGETALIVWERADPS